MNIVFFGTRMDLISGHSRPAFELAARLIQRGHDVRIVSTTLNQLRGQRHLQLKETSQALMQIPEDRPFDSLLEMALQRTRTNQWLEELLDWSDLIHGFSLNGLGLLSYRLPISRPLLLTSNTDFSMSLTDFARLRLDGVRGLTKPGHFFNIAAPNALYRSIFARIDHFISFTDYLRHRLLAFNVPPEKITRLDLGLDRSRLHPVNELHIKGRPVFLYFGMLSALRGVRTLVTAFAQVREHYPEAVLVLADRGHHTRKDRGLHNWEQQRLLRLAQKLDVVNAIRWPAFTFNIGDYLHAADAVVLPFESSFGYSQPPLTVLESMAMAKLIISTSVGSVPEFIHDGETGLLVPPGDPAALAQAMLGLEDQSSRAMGQAAREVIETDHDWDTTVERLLLLYDEVQ